MTSATEVLCRLLDEQGLEWREHEAPATDCIAFFDGEGWHDCWESVGGEVNVTFSMTPVQVVAVTLGATDAKPTASGIVGTCHDVWDVELTGRLRFQCSECGAVSLEITPNFCPVCGRKVVDA